MNKPGHPFRTTERKIYFDTETKPFRTECNHNHKREGRCLQCKKRVN